ncbi:hypothetical protein [Rhodococcus pyridinivorans]|uniref:hypothetical protein n=2 Tax=Rhodococcus pyridinivorans TaxID=103816 RepID=UPI0020788649|nr:hypothetical protein [Rhodococcus pyridinivorans]USI92886.1 hypothetical protein LLA01_23440 [Rhodococcus pyridinivorans]
MSPTEFELIFVIPDLTGPGDDRIALVEEHLDVVVESHSGLTLATVTAEGADAVIAARTAAAVLSACGLPPVRSYPDMVTRQDIADRAEVSRQAVGNWVRGERVQSDPFPTPMNLVGGGVWLWGDIVAWLRRRGHDIEDMAFPSLADHSRIDAVLLQTLARSARFAGHVALSGERATVLYAPSVSATNRGWAEESFQSSYALAI